MRSYFDLKSQNDSMLLCGMITYSVAAFFMTCKFYRNQFHAKQIWRSCQTFSIPIQFFNTWTKISRNGLCQAKTLLWTGYMFLQIKSNREYWYLTCQQKKKVPSSVQTEILEKWEHYIKVSGTDEFSSGTNKKRVAMSAHRTQIRYLCQKAAKSCLIVFYLLGVLKPISQQHISPLGIEKSHMVNRGAAALVGSDV